jgi:hypothetical protein
MRELPKQVYVWEEKERGGDAYLLADRILPEVDGIKVGVYTLKEIKTIKVTTTLE